MKKTFILLVSILFSPTKGDIQAMRRRSSNPTALELRRAFQELTNARSPITNDELIRCVGHHKLFIVGALLFFIVAVPLLYIRRMTSWQYLLQGEPLIEGPPSFYENIDLPEAPSHLPIVLMSIHVKDPHPHRPVDSCRCTEENHEKYVRDNGYLYIRYKERYPNATTHVKFDKYRYPLNYMLHKSAYLVMMVDCDFIFTNFSIKIEDIWEEWSTKDTSIIVGRDTRWFMPVDTKWKVNTGAVIYKPSKWLFKFLYNVIEKGRLVNHHTTLVDQPRFNFELMQQGQLNSVSFKEVEKHRYVTVVSQATMNTYFFYAYF